MHTRLIVLTDAFEWANPAEPNSRKDKKNIPKFKNSLTVRKYVYEFLINEGFITQGMFASGPADWFVIGGGWTGDLTKIQFSPILWKSCEKELEKANHEIGYAKGFLATKRQMNAGLKIFKSFFPNFKGEQLLYRDSYDHFGYKDDAQIVNLALWNRMVKPLAEKSSDDYYEDPLVYLHGMIDDLKERTKVIEMLGKIVELPKNK